MGSVRRRGRRVRVNLDDEEVALLLALTAQVLDLLADGEKAPAGPEPSKPLDAESLDIESLDIGPLDAADPASLEQLLDVSSGPVETPRDPALLRLLPDGYRNDDDAAGEFRRLTESGLRATKRAALQHVVDDLLTNGSVQKDGDNRYDLDEAAAEAWLPALTDLRLVFGTRLEISEDDDDERPMLAEGSVRYAEFLAYDWLAWLQDSIVQALIGD